MTTQGSLGIKDYLVTMNYTIPSGEPRSTSTQYPLMLCLVYHIYKVANLASYG